MWGKPLRNSKVSEGGMMNDKSKTIEVDERITERTERVVFVWMNSCVRHAQMFMKTLCVTSS